MKAPLAQRFPKKPAFFSTPLPIILLREIVFAVGSLRLAHQRITIHPDTMGDEDYKTRLLNGDDAGGDARGTASNKGRKGMFLRHLLYFTLVVACSSVVAFFLARPGCRKRFPTELGTFSPYSKRSDILIFLISIRFSRAVDQLRRCRVQTKRFSRPECHRDHLRGTAHARNRQTLGIAFRRFV